MKILRTPWTLVGTQEPTWCAIFLRLEALGSLVCRGENMQFQDEKKLFWPCWPQLSAGSQLRVQWGVDQRRFWVLSFCLPKPWTALPPAATMRDTQVSARV